MNETRGAVSGTVFVFEGPDGAGKSTLLAEVHRLLLAETNQRVVSLAFPGLELGTLGRHVYALHHDPARFGIGAMTLTSLQLLHVAAHLDAIDTLVRPSVERGEIVLLDRSWWSTWVYGVTGGADVRTLGRMIELERAHWGDLQPAMVFLVRRPAVLMSKAQREPFLKRSAEYANLAVTEAQSTHIVTVDNDRTIEDAAGIILDAMLPVIKPATRI